MPATATLTGHKGKKKPNSKATASILRDKHVMTKIKQGREEARTDRTYS